MKIRMGFVSNSSSSSFVCCVTGRKESGMDISAEDAGMYECEKGHIFCQDLLHLSDEEQEELERQRRAKALANWKKWSKEGVVDPDDDDLDDWLGDIPTILSSFCPVCQMKLFSTDDLLAYFIKRYAGGDKAALEEELRTSMTPKEFFAYIK